MPRSNASFLGQLLGTSQKITASALDSSVSASLGGGGVATYTAIGDLPSSGLTAGDMAFVDSSDRLYIWAGSGWYNIALINRAPTIQSVLDGDGGSSPFALSLEGVATTITMLAQDSDGTPITYSAVPSAEFNAMATVSQSSNVFTITPTAIQSSTGTITFKASDGINLASEISTFILTFIIENSRYTSLLVQSVGSNNGTNSTFTDASTNNLTLTAAGNTMATTFSPYRAGGYSTYFDGTGDYMTIPTNTAFSLSADFTVEFWINTTVSGVQGIIATGNGSTVQPYFYLNGLTPTLLYNSANVATGPNITLNAWNHIAYTRSGSSIKIFTNGIAGTTASPYTESLTNAGIWISGSNSNAQLLTGHLSNLRIVKGTSVYTSNFTPPIEPLTAITGTTLLTCQNNRFIDNSVSAHAITVSGNTSVVPFGPYDYLSYNSAVNGGSVYFNGTGYITSTVSGGLGTGNFTLEWWDYLKSVGSGMLFNSRTGGTGGDGMDVSADLNITKASEVLFGPVTTATNIWRHVALVRSGSTLTRYINGVVQGSVASTSDFNGSTFYIGGNPAGNSGYMLGHISNFRAVNGTAVYTSAFTPPTEPLTAISGTSFLINATASIIDASQSSALTLVGNTKSSTTQIKYGNSSMYFDGAGDYVSIPSSAVLTADFTIEGWYWLEQTGNAYYGLLNSAPDQQNGFGIRYPDSGFGYKLQFSYNWTQHALIYSCPITSTNNYGQWAYITWTRASGVNRFFFNGVQQNLGTGPNPSTYPVASFTNSTSLSLSTVAIGYGWRGYIQDLRVTNGLARYTTTFTPPAALLEG